MTEKITDPAKTRKKAMDFLVEVSALKKINLDKLKESILLQSEILDLKASFTDMARGVVIESKIDKGKGPNIILSELSQRGVDELLASNVIGSISEEEWNDLAYRTMNKKLGNEAELDYDKQLKLMKFLSNRGFTRSQIEKAKNLLRQKFNRIK